MNAASFNPAVAPPVMTFHQKREYLRRRMLDRVTPEDVLAIMQALLHKALEGNFQALKLFLAYVMGRPEFVEKLYSLPKEEPPPARPIAAPAPTTPASRNSKPATPTPTAAVPVAAKPMPMAAVPTSAKPDAPAAKTQSTSQLDKPLVSPEEFERLINQPINPHVGNPRGVSVIAGPDQKNKRS